MAVDGIERRPRGNRKDLEELVSTHHIQLTWVSSVDRTIEPVSRGQTSGANGDKGNIFSCPADHKQDWQPYRTG